MGKTYPARVRTFRFSPKYHPQPFFLASKHETKTAAKEKKKELKGKGFAVRIVPNKTEKKFCVYARKW